MYVCVYIYIYVCMYIMEYYSAIKKNETCHFKQPWMDLEIII